MDTVVKGDHFDCQLLTIMADVISMSLNVVSEDVIAMLLSVVYGRSYSHDLLRQMKEAVYKRVICPSLNKNIGKYHLPHTWDEVLLTSQNSN